MAKEKNLTTVTSVAAADFARLVTSAGASVKATAANLAKYVVETYNGSTVAGSAQSVKSALDSLNSKIINSASTQTIVETILAFPIGTPVNVHFSGEASSTITGSNAQIGGTAYKADTTVVDMFVSGYGSSRVYSIRITKNAVGDYTVTRKSVTLS